MARGNISRSRSNMNTNLILALAACVLWIQPISVLAQAAAPEQNNQSQESANPAPRCQQDADKPQAQQPETTPQGEPAPAQEPEQSAPAKPDAGSVPPAPQAAPPPTTPEPAPNTSAPASQSRKGKKKSRRPAKVIVREGGTSEPSSQLAPGMSNEQAEHSRQSTDKLLFASQENLKRASARTLSTSEQATVEQIKVFIEQANAALKAGDFRRGHNLATKAHALSEDLLKQ